MGKADGTAIRNPDAFVAGIAQRGYKEMIYDANGTQIRDPVKYLEKRNNGAESSGDGKKGEGMFKADGTRIRNPAAFVAGIEKRGYNEDLFDGAGKKIRDPVAFVKALTPGALS